MLEPITPQRARAIARSGAAHLAGLVGDTGRFRYRYLIGAASSGDDGVYSNVRHLGALMAMLDWESEAGWSDLLAAAIDRAAGHAAAMAAPFGTTDQLCVHDEGVIKLGGPALAVAVFLALYRRGGRAADLDCALRLGRYVAGQRRPDGDFVHILIPGPIARPHPSRSDMITGQAVLALALLGDATGDAFWGELALDSAQRLARLGHGTKSRSHWMLYALEVLHASRPEPWLADYAARIAAELVAAQWQPATPGTPIACASEGLLAFARMLPAGTPERTEALAVVRRNLRRQLKFHAGDGAFVRGLDLPEVRIDYIMHNVAGLLGYARLAAGDERRGAA